MCQCAQITVTGQSQTSLAKVKSSHEFLSGVLFSPLNVRISIIVDVDCGEPVNIPHSVMLWDHNSTVGSQVVYQCDPGYHNVGERSVSVCTATGEWDGAPMLCQGNKDINLCLY